MIVDAPLQFPECCRYQLLGETDTTRRLAEILAVLRPAARFKGFVDSRAAQTADYLVVCDLAVPGAAAAVRERDDPALIVMPLPLGDVWSYWTLAPHALDKVRLAPRPHMSDDDLLRTIVGIGRAAVDPQNGQVSVHRGAFLSMLGELVTPHMDRIMPVFERLTDQASIDTYKMVIAGRAEMHWAHYVARAFDTVQYQEAIDYAQCRTVVNGGIFGGYELPFLISRLPAGAAIHSVDPEGFDHLTDYVRPWLEVGLQRQVEHRVALDRRDGTLNLAVNGMGQLTGGDGEREQAFPARSIDSLVAAEGIGQVDLIKLDLEGGDLDAVAGAAGTIRAHRPQLAISIYHRVSDLWEMPQMIFALCPDYDFYVRNYSCERWETLLYGIPKEVAARRAAA